MLQDQIGADLITAMKAKDALKVEVFRGLKSAFTNELVATKRMPTDPLPDVDALNVIKREVKKRKKPQRPFVLVTVRSLLRKRRTNAPS